MRLLEDVTLEAHGRTLASTVEAFHVPNDVCGEVQDKSTWAREFIFVQNTLIDPGFEGDHLTLEITNDSDNHFNFKAGTPIAQIKFQWLDEPTERPYGKKDKYQNQGAGVGPIYSFNVQSEP